MTEKELLSVIYGIHQFKVYLYGQKFTVQTDHAALWWLLKLHSPSPRLARWSLTLQQYDFEIVHKPGRLNVLLDILSRMVNAYEIVDVTPEQGSLFFEKLRVSQRNDVNINALIQLLEKSELRK